MYAKAKGRSPAWHLFALLSIFGIAGFLVGLLALAALEDDEASALALFNAGDYVRAIDKWRTLAEDGSVVAGFRHRPGSWSGIGPSVVWVLPSGCC